LRCSSLGTKEFDVYGVRLLSATKEFSSTIRPELRPLQHYLYASIDIRRRLDRTKKHARKKTTEHRPQTRVSGARRPSEGTLLLSDEAGPRSEDTNNEARRVSCISKKIETVAERQKAETPTPPPGFETRDSRKTSLSCAHLRVTFYGAQCSMLNDIFQSRGPIPENPALLREAVNPSTRMVKGHS